jgi:hypothetical protein
MTLSKSDSRQRWHELRQIVNRWDPIGVFDHDSDWPQDEYECMVGPLMPMLERGRSVPELVAYMQKELREHFGLDPVPGEAEQCAAEAIAWYQSAWRDNQA